MNTPQNPTPYTSDTLRSRFSTSLVSLFAIAAVIAACQKDREPLKGYDDVVKRAVPPHDNPLPTSHFVPADLIQIRPVDSKGDTLHELIFTQDQSSTYTIRLQFNADISGHLVLDDKSTSTEIVGATLIEQVQAPESGRAKYKDYQFTWHPTGALLKGSENFKNLEIRFVFVPGDIKSDLLKSVVASLPKAETVHAHLIRSGSQPDIKLSFTSGSGPDTVHEGSSPIPFTVEVDDPSSDPTSQPTVTFQPSGKALAKGELDIATRIVIDTKSPAPSYDNSSKKWIYRYSLDARDLQPQVSPPPPPAERTTGDRRGEGPAVITGVFVVGGFSPYGVPAVSKIVRVKIRPKPIPPPVECAAVAPAAQPTAAAAPADKKQQSPPKAAAKETPPKGKTKTQSGGKP